MVKRASDWEKKLNISTGAGDYEKDDVNHSRYEPTDYRVLERLAAEGGLTAENVLVDYGCGKGRVAIFMNHALGMRTVGVEYDPALYAAALKNLDAYAGKSAERRRAEFVCANAEIYEVGKCDRFYFFNPFSVSILRSVVSRIVESYYESPRPMRLFFYFALDSYREYLMTDDRLTYSGEIDCRDLFPGSDEREKILIFNVDP